MSCYYIDEDNNKFDSIEQFEEFYFDDIIADGVIKDDFERASEIFQEYKGLEYVCDK